MIGARKYAYALNTGVAVTRLRREADGTVTVLSLASPRPLFIDRQADGSVTVH